MNIDKTYDYIIYSAGLAGVLTAIELSNKGQSVLLLNFYGFLGGSITESLNCNQFINGNNLDGSVKIIFDKIKKANHGILYHAAKEFLFNPETIKIILQQELENSKVDLLFHIVPFYLKQKKDCVEVSLTGKEGIFNIKGKTIIDASDEYDLLKLENAKRSLININYNLFLTALKDDEWQSYSLIEKKIQLNNDRFWISLKLPHPENEFFIENNSQKIINEFEELVHESGGRLQLIPSQSQKIFGIEKKKISDRIFHINSLLNENLNHKKIFITCSELEIKFKMTL